MDPRYTSNNGMMGEAPSIERIRDDRLKALPKPALWHYCARTQHF